MPVTLRPLTEANRQECLNLSISDEEMNHSQLGTMSEILAEVDKDATRIALTIYNDEKMVGFTDYYATPENNGYHIYHFLIDENHRGCHYGTDALKSLVEDLCQKPDCERITVSYMSFNDTGAIELYEKMGFVEQATEDDSPGDRFAVRDCI